MEMLPNDVRQHRFRKAVRGYAADEVDQFLEHIAGVLEEALGSRQKAEEEQKRLEKELRRFRDQEDALKKAVLTVEHAMAQSREVSMKEVELLKRQAESKAMQIVNEAELERRKMEQDLKFLRDARQSFIEQFRAFCRAQLSTLDNLDGGPGRAAQTPAPARATVTAPPRPTPPKVEEPRPAPPAPAPAPVHPTPPQATSHDRVGMPWELERPDLGGDVRHPSEDLPPSLDADDDESEETVVIFPPPLRPSAPTHEEK